jgi:hypothetical protein
VKILMKRAKLNYWVDVSIGVSFILSAVSGLVFLLPVNSVSGLNSILSISYPFWDQLHTWSSLVMIAGVLAHLVLHWKWIVGMTKKTLLPARKPKEGTTSTIGTGMTRRQFLSLGSAAVLTGAILAGYWTLTRTRIIDTEQEGNSNDPLPISPVQSDWSTDTEQGSYSDVQLPAESEQSAQQQSGVACPRGLVNDPYPGRCRNYTDRNGDGICDYSVLGSGNNDART